MLPITNNIFPTSFLVDEGSALTSTFVLSTHSWEDDVEDLPLTYLFAYIDGSANESDVANEIIVRPTLESAIISDVYLPQASAKTLAMGNAGGYLSIRAIG